MFLKIVKTAFIDASAAIRWILRATNAFQAFGSWEKVGASFLFETECRRAFYRMLHDRKLNQEQYLKAVEQLEDILAATEIIPLHSMILSRANSEFVYPIKTLDAIHLSSAWLWQQNIAESITLVSHDDRMNLIARSIGLKILENA